MRGLIRNLLCCLLTAVAPVSAPAAPQETASHRVLKFPDQQSTSLQQQMQLLQQLKSLITPESTPESETQKTVSDQPDGENRRSPPRPFGGSSEQLEDLQMLMQQFGGRLPEGVPVPRLDQIPQEQLEEALTNPAVRQLMRQLLERYAQDRTLPPATASGVRPSLPPLPRTNGAGSGQPGGTSRSSQTSPQNQRPKPSADRRSARERTANDPTPADKPSEQNSQTPDSKVAARKPAFRRENPAGEYSPVPTDSQAGDNQGNLPDRQQQALNDLQQLWKSLGGPEQLAPSFNDPRSRSGNQQSTEGSASGPRGLPSNDIMDAGIPRMHRAPESADDIRRNDANPEESRQRRPVPDPDGDRRNRGFPGMPDASRRRSEDAVSNSGGLPDPDQQTGRNSPADSRNSRPESENTASVPEIDVREELASSGLKGTLRKIIEQSKQQVRQSKQTGESVTGTSQPSMTSRLENSILQALDGVRQQVVERSGTEQSGAAKSGIRQQSTESGGKPEWKQVPSPSAASPSSRNPVSTWRLQPPDAASAVTRRSESAQGMPSGSSGLREAASRFFSEIATAPSSGSMSSGRSGSSLLQAPASPEGWVTLILLPLVVLLLALLMAVRSRLVHGRKSGGWAASALAQLRGAEIRTREDIIRAFHALVRGSRTTSEDWWTHVAAANELSQSAPASRTAVQTLAAIYEQARYAPPHAEISTDQILLAKQSLKRCEACLIEASPGEACTA